MWNILPQKCCNQQHFRGTLVHSTRAVLSNWVTRTPSQECLERHHPSQLGKQRHESLFWSATFCTLHTQDTTENPSTQGDLHFWTKPVQMVMWHSWNKATPLTKTQHQQKNCNFLLLGLTSRKYTKWERMAKLWPSESHFIVEGLAAPTEKPLLESSPADLKGTEKQVSPADTAGYGHYKKPTMNIKPVCVCRSWSPTGDVPPRHKRQTKSQC